jgi:hypothetical protein
MKNFKLWDWPNTWEIKKGHQVAIDFNAPQMSNITCKYCGRVFSSIGTRGAHERASLNYKTKNRINDVEGDWRGCPKTGLKEKYVFVPPRAPVSKQGIANWYYGRIEGEPELEALALQMYNNFLTTKKDDVFAGIAVGNPVENTVVANFFDEFDLPDRYRAGESVSAPQNTGLPSGWEDTLGNAVQETARPWVFSKTLNAKQKRAERQRLWVAEAREARQADQAAKHRRAAAKARRAEQAAAANAMWDEPPDPYMLDIPVFDDGIVDRIVGSKRPRGRERSASFELLPRKKTKIGGRRNTRKKRKKTRKTRKKKRKKRRRTRKKKRKGR